MKPKQSAQAITLPTGFSESERGHVWLTNEDGTDHNIWIDLGGDNRLEITIRPEDYPGLSVATVKVNDADLGKHIRRNCGGMVVRKLNVDGMDDVDRVIPEENDQA